MADILLRREWSQAAHCLLYFFFSFLYNICIDYLGTPRHDPQSHSPPSTLRSAPHDPPQEEENKEASKFNLGCQQTFIGQPHKEN